MDKLDSGESKHLENSVVLKAPDNNLVRSTTPKFSCLGAFEENDNKQFKLDIHLDSVMRNYIDSSAENLINDDTTSYDTSSNSPSLLPKDEMPKHDITVAMDNLSGVTLETFIVGRKFSDEEELNIGASISLLRDPDNVKDPNAIKVCLLFSFVYFEFYFSLHSLLKGLRGPLESGPFYSFRMQ